MGLDTSLLKEESVGATSQGAAGDENVELRRVACHVTESLFNRILRKIFPDQRKSERHLEPPLVGYLGMAHSSRPYELGDVCLSGFCLLTDERWEPGTEMPITLRRTNLPEGHDPECFTVQATVLRCDANRVGFSIVLSEEDSQSAYGNPLRMRWITRLEMENFLQRMKEQSLGEASYAPEESSVGTTVGGNAGLKVAFGAGSSF